MILHLADPSPKFLAKQDAHAVRGLPTIFRHPHSGNDVYLRVGERNIDALRQRISVSWQYAEMDSHHKVLQVEDYPLINRWTHRHELRYLLELTGFIWEEEFSDFQGSPPTVGTEQVVIARKPGEA